MKFYSSKQRLISLLSCGIVLLNVGYKTNTVDKDIYFKPAFVLENNQKKLKNFR